MSLEIIFLFSSISIKFIKFFGFVVFLFIGLISLGGICHKVAHFSNLFIPNLKDLFIIVSEFCLFSIKKFVNSLNSDFSILDSFIYLVEK